MEINRRVTRHRVINRRVTRHRVIYRRVCVAACAIVRVDPRAVTDIMVQRDD